MRITVDKWRTKWAQYIGPPDSKDRAREGAFLADHARYGARIHGETAATLAEAVKISTSVVQKHTLFLRLFAEYVNALETLGAWGWTFRSRFEVRSFLDGLLAYPTSGPRDFYRSALNTEGTLVELLKLPARQDVIRAARDLVEAATARDVGEWLDDGRRGIRDAAEQYFTRNTTIVTYYNKAKHGVTMLRLPEHIRDEYDFQVIAPQQDEARTSNNEWYEIAQFRADDATTEKLQRSTAAITSRIQQLANLAWILSRSGCLYYRPDDASGGQA